MSTCIEVVIVNSVGDRDGKGLGGKVGRLDKQFYMIHTHKEYVDTPME